MEIKMRLFFSLKGFGSRQARKQHPHRPSSTPFARPHLGNRTEIFFFVLCYYPHSARKCCEGFPIVSCFCSLPPSGEKWMKIAIRNQATSFPSFFSPAFLALSTSSSHETCDCRLEKLEIIDFVCCLPRYGSSLASITAITRSHAKNFLAREHRGLSTKTTKSSTHFLSHHSFLSKLRYLPFFCEMKFR